MLEIGTGSGYQTAILAELAREVVTIEVVEDLATAAQSKLEALGYRNIEYRRGDGAGAAPSGRRSMASWSPPPRAPSRRR